MTDLEKGPIDAVQHVASLIKEVTSPFGRIKTIELHDLVEFAKSTMPGADSDEVRFVVQELVHIATWFGVRYLRDSGGLSMVPLEFFNPNFRGRLSAMLEQ